jgi:hypothetical protein
MFAAGQRWTYRAPPGSEDSRIVIGAVVAFAEGRTIVCCSVLAAPQRMPDGSIGRVTIPFLPMAADALAASVGSLDGEGAVPPEFAPQLAAWQADARGLSFFTVPIDGSLEGMIARQMAEIAGVDPGRPE